MSGPWGNQLVLFSLVSCRLGKYQDSRENKANCFPRDLTLNVYSAAGPKFTWYLHWCLYNKIVPSSQRSLSHAVLRLGTDSLVLLINALKRKGRVWVGKKYIQDETSWLTKERTPEKGISGAVFILQRFARSIEWHYLFRLISFYT